MGVEPNLTIVRPLPSGGHLKLRGLSPHSPHCKEAPAAREDLLAVLLWKQSGALTTSESLV